jgi:hypothetical protein
MSFGKLRLNQPEFQNEEFIQNKLLPKANPVTITEVDGVEIRVERVPLRYEKVEDIFDDLPDFAQEVVANQYLNHFNK